MSTREEQASGHASPDNPAPDPKRSTSSTGQRPQGLVSQPSTGSARTTRPPNSAARPSYRQPTESARTQHENVSETASQPPTAQESRRAHANAHSLQRQQTEKRQDDAFYVDNDYFDLNPWYDQQPKKPVFGLNKPFPRTVRPGMLWGRNKNLPKGRDGTQGGPTLHVPLGENQPLPPDSFDAEIGGQQYEVRRVGEGEGEQLPQDGDLEAFGIEGEDYAPDSDAEDTPSQTQGSTRPNYRTAFSGGLSPLEEIKSTQSYGTQQTEKEEKDQAQKDEQKALEDYYNKYRNPLARLRAKYPEAPAEFLCTTIYVFFGIAGSLYSHTYPAQQGDYQTQAWAWGMAVMAGIYVGGGVSGAHMSPWISVAFSVFRGFPSKMCLVYSIVQILAGFAAGALAWFIYRDGILYTDPGLTPETTGIAFYYIPRDYVSSTTSFFNSFVSSALYVCVVFAVGDDSNTPPGSGMSALVYGLVTYLLCITMGYNGLGISPARDLGPRFIAWWVGYGRDTFATGWWAYGPILAGLSGSLVGALIYDIFIFSGGESPVNYNWPHLRDVKWRYRARKEQLKEHARKLEV